MYFNKEKVIADTLCYHYKKESKNNETARNSGVNIAYGVDKNFLFGCGISIASILLNNPNINFHFFIFTDYINDDFNNKINLLAKQYNTSISIYLVDCKELTQLPTTKNWSYATYFRFIIADILYPEIDKLLYIDADIICKGSLQELIELDINNYVVAAVKEGEAPWWQTCAKRLGIENLASGYFNAGFLYINLRKWHDDDVSSIAMSLLVQEDIRAKLDFLDQDLLNIILVDKVYFLDKRYNRQFSINYELKAPKGTYYKNPIDDQTVFIHYIGPTKPWHEWAGDYPCATYFIQAKNASPWQYVPLLKAINANQSRYCAKHKFHQNKIAAGVLSYIKYYWKKIYK